jgi:hypothetical protein
MLHHIKVNQTTQFLIQYTKVVNTTTFSLLNNKSVKYFVGKMHRLKEVTKGNVLV